MFRDPVELFVEQCEARGVPAPVLIERATILRSDVLCVERLRCIGLNPEPTPLADSPERQVLLTLDGSFEWRIGRERHFVDTNQIVFVREGEESQDSHPTRSDVRCLLLTPSRELAGVLWREAGPRGDPFSARTAPASNVFQLRFMRFAAAIASERAHEPANEPAIEPAEIEERAIALLGEAGEAARRERRRTEGRKTNGRLVRRAKALLSSSGRPLRLVELARALSVSPAYLTDVFRRAEGVPLVRYQLKLRLARALAELPHADDLTALALELGFSSHSHFTTAFRSAMGVTPSEYRRGARATERS